jgi:hypothetical protein
MSTFSDYPVLLRYHDLIAQAVMSGQSATQISDNLRRRGARVTTEQVTRYCDLLSETANGDSPSNASAFGGQREAAEAEFPELLPQRKRFEAWINQGLRSDEIYANLKLLLKIDSTPDRVRAYYTRIYDELYPVGPIQRRLFEVRPPERTWSDHDHVIGFGDEPNSDDWTHRDLCQGVAVLGSPGSGKTSGSTHMFIVEMLKQGYGAIMHTAKVEDAARYFTWVQEAGRVSDLVVIRPDGPARLSLLQYEVERPGCGASMTTNLVSFIQNLLSATGSGSMPAKEGGEFWRTTGQQLLANLIEVLVMAKEPMTLDSLCEFVAHAPTEPEDVEGWEDREFFGSCLKNAQEQASTAGEKRVLTKLEDYWLNIFPNLAPNTRSCITAGFTSMADILRGPQIYDLVSTRTTITPEMVMGGKIVIIDLPVGEYGMAGVLVQCAWKYVMQRALLRRTEEGDARRPVLMAEDEGHLFVIENDNEFQAVSREYRVARLLVSQNLNNFVARYGGGEYARTKVDSLLANINTRIFHANGDPVTNKWASDCIGTAERIVIETSSTPATYGGTNPIMGWFHEHMRKPTVTTMHRVVREPAIHPHEFVGLQVGNPENGWVTQAIITQVGRQFMETGKSYGSVLFQQRKQAEIMFDGKPIK